MLFALGWSHRDRAWYGLAVLYGGALAFTPFMLWYGAYDIRAFHLPVLGPLLVATVAAHFWYLARYRRLRNAVAVLFVTIGVFRAGHVAMALWDRQPLFEGLEPAIVRMIEEAPVEQPLFAMAYPLRMATLYHELMGDLPSEPMYRVWWRAVPELDTRREVGGIVVPTDGYQFVNWIEHKRPELKCQTRKIDLPAGTRWPAYAFTCDDSQ
ncbi:hypothetical protein QW131_30735 [Roseibium salinum]|nr:hypothetical protein [Roseibium salinum]